MTRICYFASNSESFDLVPFNFDCCSGNSDDAGQRRSVFDDLAAQWSVDCLTIDWENYSDERELFARIFVRHLTNV